MTTELIPRTTISDICAHRAKTIEAFRVAHGVLADANRALEETEECFKLAAPQQNFYSYDSREEKVGFFSSYKLPDLDSYMKTSTRLVDIAVWSRVMDLTDLRNLMDKKAKDELHQQLHDNPPEATEDNIVATLQQFALDAGTIFKRGIAECFSNLDRRFKSHDGFKIGNRIILTRVFGDYGNFSYGSNHEATLVDIERTFRVLDESAMRDYSSLVYAIREDRGGYNGARQSELETDYFKIRGFKNGNAHLWMRRDDLVEKVNRLLGEYYGEVIADGQTTEEDPFEKVKRTPAKRNGFYPTPDPAAETLMENANLHTWPNVQTRWEKERGDEFVLEPQQTVLEPSAGTGNLARRCAEKGALVDCVEMQAEHAEALRRSNLYGRVRCIDFLALQPDPERLYDRVVMNPPFDLERDIDHVMHAWKFLKDDGALISIMSAGTEFRETKKAKAFRKFVTDHHGSSTDLRPGSFSSVGTNVNTILVWIPKGDRKWGGWYRYGNKTW